VGRGANQRGEGFLGTGEQGVFGNRGTRGFWEQGEKNKVFFGHNLSSQLSHGFELFYLNHFNNHSIFDSIYSFKDSCT